jgi:Tfp pilus assembly protein PilN
VRAVNLIPADSRRNRGRVSGISVGPAHYVLGALTVAIVLAVLTVLAGNTVSDRRARLATLRAQVAQATAQAGRLATYTRFEQLAQQRAETVREIAASRFNWDGALRSVSRVVPPGTSFQTLVASVAPGSSSSGTGASGLRSDLSVPAFEIDGCTSSQDQVANLMTRLRRIDGVTRVALDSSAKSGTASSGANAATGGAGGCAANSPAFALVVFFTALPTAGPNGVTSLTPVVTSGPGGAP